MSKPIELGAHTGPAFAVPNVITTPPVFQTEDLAITDYHDFVELRIGNSFLTFKYEEAFRISALIRVHAANAKARMGDTRRQKTVVGVLSGLKE